MPAPYSQLLSKCDRALVAYVISQGAGTADDVFPAKASLSKPLPCTICESRKATPVGNPYSGNYEIEASVCVRTEGSGEEDENTADTPASIADTRVGLTFDAFQANVGASGEQVSSGEQVGQAITSAAHGYSGNRISDMADFSCDNCEVVAMRAGFEAKGDGWSDIIDLVLICRPSA